MADFLLKFFDLLDRDSVFWFCALAGTGMFLIQFVLAFLGFDNPGDEGGGEMDLGKFQWLSKQALTGFLMMFGWVNLTCRKEFGLSGTVSTSISFASGLISIFITGFIFKMAKRLRSAGTVFRIEDAIGKEAMVYQRIPKNGAGKISISLHHFTHEIDAISTHPEDLPSFTSVQVIKTANETTVVVVPTK